MFSRNEKYGQALHLVYGFDRPAQKPVQNSNKGFVAAVKAFFSNTEKAHQDVTATTMIDMDRSTIEQAVQSELRNTDAAANENQLEMIKGKIA